MNSKAGLIIRIVAGMYLVFSGVTLLRQMITLKPSDYVLKSAIAVLFIVVGVWYGYRNIKATYYFVKGETEPKKDTKSVSSSEGTFKKPEYDESKYRTAPMEPVEEPTKSISLEDTALTQKTEKVAEKPVEQKVVKEPVAEKSVAEEKVSQQSATEQADPVKLAIEIMEDEDKDRMEKEAEMLEVDFEEK